MEYTKLYREDPEYPALLKMIPQAPPALYVAGNPDLLRTPCIGIVGARKASPYGEWCAGELGKKAAEYGITVVSGMAAGIDAKAHWGALLGGGKTIAVLGSGVDVCYPESNRNLYERIRKEGAVISEYPPGFSPSRTTFPARNRIISGLSRGVVIVEAALKSGSLITAEHAVKQGREVLAVPGNLNRVTSYGANKLIRDGALILTSFDDILDLFEEKRREKREASPRMNREEARIYSILKKEGEMPIAELAMRLGMDMGHLAEILTYMEIEGLLHTDFGRAFLPA